MSDMNEVNQMNNSAGSGFTDTDQTDNAQNAAQYHAVDSQNSSGCPNNSAQSNAAQNSGMAYHAADRMARIAAIRTAARRIMRATAGMRGAAGSRIGTMEIISFMQAARTRRGRMISDRAMA